MSEEVIFNYYGTRTLGAGWDAWFPIFNDNFNSNHWQKVSVFPTVYNTPPAKVTIQQEDWTIDEWRNHVCWVLVRNPGPYPVEFATTAITTPV